MSPPQMTHRHLSVLQREGFIWSLSNVPLLEGYLYVLDGDPLQEVVKSVIQQYKTSVVGKYPDFRQCEFGIYSLYPPLWSIYVTEYKRQ